MTYHAKTQRRVLGFLLVIVLGSMIMINDSHELLYVQIFLAAILVLFIFIQFQLRIDNDYLTYQILFLAMPIYKREVHPNQITHIQFKRVGWGVKGAIIQVKKGCNIRVVHFVPSSIFIDLNDFADKQGVFLSKTTDYRMLEK